MNELWLVIPDFPAYEVSDQGRVRRIGKAPLKPTPNDNGYLRVFPRHNGRYNTRYVHRLVLSTFVGSYPNDHGTNHIDGNKNNNALTNLEFKTQSANNQHAWDIGLVPRIRVKNPRCGNGHELTQDTLVLKAYRNRHGVMTTTRRCRICLNRNQRMYVSRKAGVGE